MPLLKLGRGRGGPVDTGRGLMLDPVGSGVNIEAPLTEKAHQGYIVLPCQFHGIAAGGGDGADHGDPGHNALLDQFETGSTAQQHDMIFQRKAGFEPTTFGL